MSAPRGTIRDRGYQKYDGPRTPERNRWLLVAGRMLRFTVRRRGVIALLAIAFIPLIVGVSLMYVMVQLAGARESIGMAAPSPDGYVLELIVKPYGTLLIAFLMAMLAGGSAIADDAQAGGFQLYFARPLSRDQYLAGKLVPVIILVATTVLEPAVVSSLVKVIFAHGAVAALGGLALVGRAAALGLVQALVLALPAVALSSLAGRRGAAQGSYAILFVVPWLGGELLARVMRSPWPELASMPADLEAVGRWLFALPLDENALAPPPWAAASALAILVAGSFLLLRNRIARVAS
jgi:hypothetical protein